MLTISSKVKQMIQRQQIIIVGSADKLGLSNVPPRTITIKILDKLYRQRILKYANNKIPNVIKFTAKVIYSLNPNALAPGMSRQDANNKSIKDSNMKW